MGRCQFFKISTISQYLLFPSWPVGPSSFSQTRERILTVNVGQLAAGYSASDDCDRPGGQRCGQRVSQADPPCSSYSLASFDIDFTQLSCGWALFCVVRATTQHPPIDDTTQFGVFWLLCLGM